MLSTYPQKGGIFVSRFMKISLLSVAMLALALGSAFAEDVGGDAPSLFPTHYTRASMVNGKSVYNTDKATGALSPYFYYTYIELSRFPTGQKGEMSIYLSGKAHVDFYKDSIEYIHTETYSAGWTNFKVWEWSDDPTYYFAGDENGIVAEFVANSVDPLKSKDFAPETETAISESDFNFKVGSASASGKTGKIHTTDAQMASGCVPYVEYVANGTALTGLKWRFVNPISTDTALKRSVENAISRINRINIRTWDDNWVGIAIDKNIGIGEILEGGIDLPQAQTIETNNIRFIQFHFLFEDSLTGSCQTRYLWRFYPVDQSTPDPTQPNPPTPTAEEVAAAQTAVSNDLGKMIEVKAAEQAKITTGTEVTFGDVPSARTSSVIAIDQPVTTPGDAIVLATELTLPLNSKSLNGAGLEQASDLDDLAGKYHVMKYFENGGGMDLLATFRSDDIFSYTPADGVRLNAVVVVVDDTAMSYDDASIVKPAFGDGKYGVKLSSDNKYLYIFDGIKNGVAKDPIALVKAENNNGGGSSGCNAGFGILALMAFGAILPTLRRK